MHISTIGLDLAKNVFQIHAVDDEGHVVSRRTLRRAEVLPFFRKLSPCLVGVEACATAHYWAREIGGLGHEVRLMPPAYVKPYVKRIKNDMTDAEAICEAVTRPNMRFVAIKSADQQSVLVLHRSRALLVRQRTMLANAIRAHLAEFGIIIAQGLSKLMEAVMSPAGPAQENGSLSLLVTKALEPLIVSLSDLGRRIKALEIEIANQHRASEVSRRLETIPGFGVMTSTAMAATVADPAVFRSGREFAAWLGLTPRQNSSGGKQRLGGITKMGDGYLRTLLVCGATAVSRFAREERSAKTAWIRKLLEKKPAKVVAVALANKMASIAWAIMMRRDVCRATPA